MADAITICVPLSMLLALSLAYPFYQAEIPNGRNVPHPCQANVVWQGVGHESQYGGGPRNVFGLAFAAAGHTWTPNLCQADSDGDGMTNGYELGDPNCAWAKDTSPVRAVNITHPGICDPYNSDKCKNKTPFLTCDPETTQASDTLNNTGTTSDTLNNTGRPVDPETTQASETLNNTEAKNITLSFPETEVPPTKTNYLCFSFDLPDDQDYHVVATEPVITNQDVVQYMVLYGCTNADIPKETAPVTCGMNAVGECNSVIGLWTLNVTGTSYPNHVGFRIGINGFRRARLEILYNNPQLIQNYTDSSGMRIYYRPVEDGDQELAVLSVGQLLIQLSPAQSRIQVEGVCPSSCTRGIVNQTAQIIGVQNRMHYLGASMNVSIYRNGTKLKDLSYDADYNYDTPVAHLQNPPFALLPGDEITTTCVYNTLSSKRYVYYGESTSDEMCYGFITFYPKEAITVKSCVAFGQYSMCDVAAGVSMDGCDWVQFLNLSNPVSAQMYSDVLTNCSIDGFCRPECREVLNGLKDHPCLKGVANEWITARLSQTQGGAHFLGRLHSCPEKKRPECREVLNGLKDHPCLKGVANQWITARLSQSQGGAHFLARLRSCPEEETCPTGDNGNAADKLIVNSVILFLATALMVFV